MKSIKKFKNQSIKDQQKIKGGKNVKKATLLDQPDLKDWWDFYAWE